jgi:cytoskeletal protein RodZ
MALSADEQRELAEIERRLATDDPGLATCMTAFRRPGPGRVLRSPRARIIGSLFTVLLIAMVSLMVYAMIPFRTHNTRMAPPSTAATSGNVAISPAGTGGPAQNSPLASASTGASATGAASSAPPSAGASTSAGQAEPTGSQAAGQAASSATGP